MFRIYGTSLCGKDHIKADRSCEDAHGYKLLKNEWAFACIADGVGSAGRGGEGARIAVDAAMHFVDHIQIDVWSDDDLSAVMRGVFLAALSAVTQRAHRENIPLSYFDTTFTAVLYLGVKTVVGHSGDGGAIGLNLIDDCLALTERQQQLDDGFAYVIPLRHSPSWSFSIFDQPMKAVLLATDGIYDQMVSKPHHDVDPFAVWCYMQPRELDKKTDEELKQKLEENLSSCEYECVGDDKTVVVLIDDSQPHTELNVAKGEAYLQKAKAEEERRYELLYGKREMDISDEAIDESDGQELISSTCSLRFEREESSSEDTICKTAIINLFSAENLTGFQNLLKPVALISKRCSALSEKLRNAGGRVYDFLSRRKRTAKHGMGKAQQQMGSSKQE